MFKNKQTVKLKSGSIKFKIYHRRWAAPFKIYVNFECNVNKVNSSDKSSDKGDNPSYAENIKTIFLLVLHIKLFVLMINLASQLLFKEEKMQSINLLKQFLKSISIAKKVIKKYFTKNLLSEED